MRQEKKSPNLPGSFVKVFFTVWAVLIFTIISSQTALANKDYVEGEVLVKFKNGTLSAIPLNEQVGASVLQEFPELKWQLVKLPDNLTVEQGIAAYQNLDGVEFVQPNYIYHVLNTPNDPRYGELYGMTQISAPTAWDTTTGSDSIVVAVIDTGIKYTHEDLAPNMWRNPGEIAGNNVDDDNNGLIDDVYGYDFIDNDSDPSDVFNHGTHVAGTIGAAGNNALGVAGVNWRVKIMALRIHDAAGNSTAATVIRAFQYARMMRLRGVNLRVTNNSYGGAPEAPGYDQATKDAIDAAGEANILNVFSSGNNGRDIEAQPFYPASYNSPSILVVAASGAGDVRANFSNFGTTSVDLAAPGAGILSSVIGTNNSTYGINSGTSMAAPHVSGAAALLAAANPNLSAASLKATLMNRVDPIAVWNGVLKTGGRLNIASAIANQTVCNFGVPSGQVFAIDGGNGNVNITAPTNCDFSAVSQVPWITVNSGNSGSGSTTVTFTVGSNAGNITRSGVIKIANQNFTILQRGTNFDPAPVPPLDFDGDARTDFSAIQNVGGTMVWHNLNSFAGYQPGVFGLFATDEPVPADYDGDFKTDIAIWRNGGTGQQSFFYYLASSNNTFRVIPWGVGGDNPKVTQDFDGDNKADPAVTRKIGGKLYWYISQTTAGFRLAQFGDDTDIPLRGDYDGDGKKDLAVYRPANNTPANTFFVVRSSNGVWIVQPFGVSTTDKIVPADFDGDGKTDFAVWRTTNGVWYWLTSSNGVFNAVQFGIGSTDLPVVGDYDGDGKTDLAVWRPNALPTESGIFYVNRSTSGFTASGWGNSSMKIPANTLQIGN